MSSFDYQKSTLTKYRMGTSTDPYIDITETKTVINGQILLNEIPVQLNKIRIPDMFEVPHTNRNDLKENEYRVDYSEGIISFHISAEDTSKTYSYKGRGNHYVSASRIWTEEHDGNVIKTLKDAVDASNEAIIKVDNLDKVIAEAEVALQEMEQATSLAETHAKAAEVNAQYAKEQGDYAGEQADIAKDQSKYAKSQGDYAKEQGDFAKDQANNAQEIIVEADSKIEELNDSIQNANEKIDETEQARLLTLEATENATTQADLAKSAAESATTQGEYAKEQGDLAKSEVENTREFLTEVNHKVDELQEALDTANVKIGETELAIQDAHDSAEYAKAQGDYAKDQAEHTISVAESLVHRGNYSSTDTYVERNIVYFNGATFMSLKDSTGEPPTNTEFWKKVTNTTWQGIYSPDNMYNFGDIVTDTNHENVYMCIADETLDIEFSNVANWTLMISISSVVSSAKVATEEAIEAKDQAVDATTTANAAATHADEKANQAETQASYAETQGDYARAQGELAYDRGTSLANRGIYSSTITYKPLNIVVYDSGVYQNIKESVDIPPTDTSYWVLLLKTSTSVTWDSIAGKPDIEAHLNAEDNPHKVTAEQVNAYTKTQTDATFGTKKEVESLNSDIEEVRLSIKEIDSSISTLDGSVELIHTSIETMGTSIDELESSKIEIVTDLNQHVSNEEIHTTIEEKTVWNNKQDALSYTPESVEDKGKPSGYASLDADGKIPLEQLPENIGSGGSVSDPAKVFNERFAYEGDPSINLSNPYRYNNSMKAVLGGITLFIPDSDISGDGYKVNLQAISDYLDISDQFTLTWFDNTPLGRKVARVIAILDESGTVQLTDLSYEMNNNYCSVYVDGVRFFEGNGSFTFQELTSTTIKINGDFSGSEVQIEILTN